MNHGTPMLLALVLLAGISAASAKTIFTIRGGVTNSLDPNAVIEIGAHVTGPSISSVNVAPVQGQGFITPADSGSSAPLALATCRFAVSGEWVHEDRSVYLTGMVRSSSDPRLVGARFVMGASIHGYLVLFFDTDPDHPQVGGPLEYYGIGSVEIHETK